MNFQGRCSLLFAKRQMGFLSTHPAQSTVRQRQKQQSPRHLAGLRGKNHGPQHSPQKWNTIKTALSYPVSGSTCSGSWAVGREVKLKPCEELWVGCAKGKTYHLPANSARTIPVHSPQSTNEDHPDSSSTGKLLTPPWTVVLRCLHSTTLPRHWRVTTEGPPISLLFKKRNSDLSPPFML